MRSIVIIGISLLMISCAGQPKHQIYNQYLYSGEINKGISKLETYLSNRQNAETNFSLGFMQLVGAFEALAQDLYSFGLQNQGDLKLIFNIPIPNNPHPNPISYKDFRTILEKFYEKLKDAEKTLAQRSDPDFKYPLKIGMIKIDIDNNQRFDDWESFWKIFENIGIMENIDEADATELTIQCDTGDVFWLQSYLHIVMATIDFILAYDWEFLWPSLGNQFFAQPIYKGFSVDKNIFNSSRSIFKLKHSRRMRVSLFHLKLVPLLSRKSWEAIINETDNDNEWIPNSKQVSVLGPQWKVSEEMIQTWFMVLKELERLLNGQVLIKFDKDIGVNISKIFLEARDIRLNDWLMGNGFYPYLEKGPFIDMSFFNIVNESFSGRFPLFAIWFN